MMMIMIMMITKSLILIMCYHDDIAQKEKDNVDVDQKLNYFSYAGMKCPVFARE